MSKHTRASKNTPRIEAFHEKSIGAVSNSNFKRRFLSDSPIQIGVFNKKTQK